MANQNQSLINWKIALLSGKATIKENENGTLGIDMTIPLHWDITSEDYAKFKEEINAERAEMDAKFSAVENKMPETFLTKVDAVKEVAKEVIEK